MCDATGDATQKQSRANKKLDKHLHIVSLDVPYPVDYGGVYDLFYKLPALQAQGVKIHLHCFENSRGRQPELDKYCEEVFYYKRRRGCRNFLYKLPYIITSRISGPLLQNLMKDDFPILMEGIHCTYPLLDKRFAQRKKFVRIHNVEQQYYKQLFRHSKNPFQKIYYRRESRLLMLYEKSVAGNATACWAVTKKDVDFYRNQLHGSTINYLPLFLPPWEVQCREGTGSFCLYHGNLSVAENEYAAIWLLKNVFAAIEIPFVIAGKKPSKRLRKIVKHYANASLVADPVGNEMQDMIAKAQINILPSFSSTGIKLKLINALYNGRHCLVNDEMLAGTELQPHCHLADSAGGFIEKIKQLFSQLITKQEMEARRKSLYSTFNNETGAGQIIKWIWKEG